MYGENRVSSGKTLTIREQDTTERDYQRDTESTECLSECTEQVEAHASTRA